nr:MAG TPA: hypothetical protein [Caudoviricetes sp.]
MFLWVLPRNVLRGKRIFVAVIWVKHETRRYVVFIT